MDDNKRSSISAYRKYLYKKIIERKKEVGSAGSVRVLSFRATVW